MCIPTWTCGLQWQQPQLVKTRILFVPKDLDKARPNHMTLLTNCGSKWIGGLAKNLASLADQPVHAVAIKAKRRASSFGCTSIILFIWTNQIHTAWLGSHHRIHHQYENTAMVYSAGLSLVHTEKPSQHYSTVKLLHRADDINIQEESILCRHPWHRQSYPGHHPVCFASPSAQQREKALWFCSHCAL